jgi:RNA polymerase sigma-70 factor (ECF subfamily)
MMIRPRSAQRAGPARVKRHNNEPLLGLDELEDGSCASGAVAEKTGMPTVMRNALSHHLPALQRYAASLTGDPDDAEALVQACIAAVLQETQGGAAGTRVDSWLFRTAQRLWSEHQRAGGQRLAATTGAPAIAAAETADTPRREELQLAEAAFADLTEGEQSLAALVVLHGASYDEAAVALGITRDAVSAHLAELRRRLTAKLDPPGVTPA